MSDLTIISTMFEEIKDAVKQILSKLSESKKSDNNTNENNHIDKLDLSEITEQVCQSEGLIIHKLEQIEQTNAAPKKVHHRISIDIASSWVFLTIIALTIILLISFFFYVALQIFPTFFHFINIDNQTFISNTLLIHRHKTLTDNILPAINSK